MLVSLGLDLSATAPGLVLLGKQRGLKSIDVLVAEQIPVPPPAQIGRFERVQLIAEHVALRVHEHGPGVVAIEGYGQASHFGIQSFIKCVEVGTLVKLWLHENGLAWSEVPPSSLKKFVTGKGKLPSGKKGKQFVIDAVAKNWGHVTKNDNIADAYGLAMFALARASVIPIQPWQVDAMDAVQCK